MFIYKITNTINGKSYIGLTTKSITHRFNEHLHQSKSITKPKYPLQLAIIKYGSENFTIDEIDTARGYDELKEKEIFWIKYYNTFNGIGYNLTAGGELIWANQTKEFRNYHSKQVKQGWKNISPERRAEMSKAKSKIWHDRDEIHKNAITQQRIAGHKKFWGNMSKEERAKHAIKGGAGARRRHYILFDPDKKQHEVYGLRKFCIERNLNYTALVAMITQQRYEHVHGWTGYKVK